MKITRIVATEEGESRFTEFDIPFDNIRQAAEGVTVRSSKGCVSSNFRFSEFPIGFDWGGRHSAPTRQLVIILSGVVEIETSDRQTQQWRAGAKAPASANHINMGRRRTMARGNATLEVGTLARVATNCM